VSTYHLDDEPALSFILIILKLDITALNCRVLASNIICSALKNGE